MPTLAKLEIDILCRRVDNFGDIGFCWRLARELHHAHNVQVRLLLDDFQTARLIIPQINSSVSQVCDGVEIASLETPHLTLRHMVISTFGAAPPTTCSPAYHTIQLEYLSAESWVEDCHARTALGTTRIFYFPGFTAKTGGLLREQHLLSARKAFDHQQQKRFLSAYGATENALCLSLFCYPHAEVEPLWRYLATAPLASHLFIPTHQPQYWRERLQAFHTAQGLPQGVPANQRDYRLGQLQVHLLPFLSQAQYDRLLWSCDCNWVRGEDSWVRALWASNPLLWQPYPQSAGAHHVKLEAFLAHYSQGANPALAQLMVDTQRAWSGLGVADWSAFFATLDAQKRHAQQVFQRLLDLPELATGLVNMLMALK